MISTFYSNSFEVLRTVLATKIGFNLEDLRNSNASFFEQIKVIVPTPMIEDNLNRFFADHFGATPGIEFSNVASWMFKVLGQSLSNAETKRLSLKKKSVFMNTFRHWTPSVCWNLPVI